MKNLTPNTTYLRNSALKHSFRLKVVAFETCCLQLWGPSLKVSLLHFQRALAFLNLYFHFWVVKCFQTNTINYRSLWESANNQSSHQVVIVAAPSRNWFHLTCEQYQGTYSLSVFPSNILHHVQFCRQISSSKMSCDVILETTDKVSPCWSIKAVQV